MNLASIRLCIAATVILAVWGCGGTGGSGGTSGGGGGQPEGLFQGFFASPDQMAIVAVNSDGSVDAGVVKRIGGDEFVGRGHLDSKQSFSMPVSDDQGTINQLSGVCSGSGTGARVTCTYSVGNSRANCTAAYVSSEKDRAVSGNFNVSATDAAGTVYQMTISIDGATGNVTGSGTARDGYSVTVTGSMTELGKLVAKASESIGNFIALDGSVESWALAPSGAGTFTSNFGVSGNWTAQPAQ